MLALQYASKFISGFQEIHDADFELTEVKPNVTDVLERIQQEKQERLFKKRFADQRLALSYAYKNILAFQGNSDPHFSLIDETDSEAMTKVTDALTHLFQLAKKEGAVVIVPDYTTSSPSSLLIEQALEEADFDGVVINIGNDNWIACDRESFGGKFQFPGLDTEKDRGIVLSRATHSFQVSGNAMTYSLLAARLAKVVSGGYLDGEESGFDKDMDAVAVIGAGGASVLNHMAELVREGIPMIVLEGSGRLSNLLPKLYVERFTSGFDLEQASRRFCEECGFPKTGMELMGRWVRSIIEEGNLNIHQISNSLYALQRVLISVKHRDEALAVGAKRRLEYLKSARKIGFPSTVMLVLKVSVGFVITLLATIQSQPGSVQIAVTNGLQQIQTHFNNTLMAIDRGPVLHYFVVALPVFFTLVISLQQSLNYGPRYLSQRYAAALVESETYRYRTRTGQYSEEQLCAFAKTDRDFSGLFGYKQDDEAVAYDTISVRTYRLTKKLVEINANVELFERPDLSEKIKKSMECGIGIKQETISELTLGEPLDIEWMPSEFQLGVLHGDDYLQRIRDKMHEFERNADSLFWLLVVYKFFTYTLGALGSIFALINCEVDQLLPFLNTFCFIHLRLDDESGLGHCKHCIPNGVDGDQLCVSIRATNGGCHLTTYSKELIELESLESYSKTLLVVVDYFDGADVSKICQCSRRNRNTMAGTYASCFF